MTVQLKAAFASKLPGLAWSALALACAMAALPAQAQNFPITPGQRATAQQVAQAGVPLADLAPNAPDNYTIKTGDTLWAIAGMYLKTPWRWPELWGMNLQEVRNPHRIYPGQQLVLEKKDGRATLRVRGADDSSAVPTVRVSPRVRIEKLDAIALPTLKPHLIEPFLAEPIIVSEGVIEAAPRIVATTDERVLLTRGDRAYARASTGAPLKEGATVASDRYRVFRNATPLRDPVTRAVLGYEAQFLGRAELVRGEGVQMVRASNGESSSMPVPATLDIVSAREEMRVGDRLLPEPPRQLTSYVPRAPSAPMQGGAIVSMYGDAVGVAAQNQVVVVNKGTADGIENGHVLAILKSGAQLLDRSQPGERQQIKLPDERNGLMMVFRTFDKLSYALILESNEGVKIGDTVTNPR
ncbi:MAG TPA: LysM domain-containing protein [Ramlibacter sp.]|nr:LysM domain-containing protein [Ramlibacter sp.]